MSFKKPFRAPPIRQGAYYAARRRKRRQQQLTTKMVAGSMLAVLVGAGSYLSGSPEVPTSFDHSQPVDTTTYVPPTRTSAEELDAQQPSARPQAFPREVPTQTADSGWSYPNCAAARAAGAAPIKIGEPGYGSHLDRDGDGIACEPYHGPR